MLRQRQWEPTEKFSNDVILLFPLFLFLFHICRMRYGNVILNQWQTRKPATVAKCTSIYAGGIFVLYIISMRQTQCTSERQHRAIELEDREAIVHLRTAHTRRDHQPFRFVSFSRSAFLLFLSIAFSWPCIYLTVIDF